MLNTDSHSKSFLYYVPFTIFFLIGHLGELLVKKQDGFSPLHEMGNRLDVPDKSSKQPAFGMGLN